MQTFCPKPGLRDVKAPSPIIPVLNIDANKFPGSRAPPHSNPYLCDVSNELKELAADALLIFLPGSWFSQDPGSPGPTIVAFRPAPSTHRLALAVVFSSEPRPHSQENMWVLGIVL